jgi:2'-5' RNA ligase
MRIFFALWPPAETAAALARWAREAQRATGGKTIDAAKIHLTLAFLGEADPARATQAARRVRARAHSLPLEEARYWRESHIVWAGPRETPAALTALVESLGLQLYREEFILERRPFADPQGARGEAAAAARARLAGGRVPPGALVAFLDGLDLRAAGSLRARLGA